LRRRPDWSEGQRSPRKVVSITKRAGRSVPRSELGRRLGWVLRIGELDRREGWHDGPPARRAAPVERHRALRRNVGRRRTAAQRAGNQGSQVRILRVPPTSRHQGFAPYGAITAQCVIAISDATLETCVTRGAARIRTGDRGFAVLCLTTWPRRRSPIGTLPKGSKRNFPGTGYNTVMCWYGRFRAVGLNGGGASAAGSALSRLPDRRAGHPESRGGRGRSAHLARLPRRGP
jgi:hypothetical protein